MTRWEQLLEALGVDAERFELEHQSKFDLSPRQWVLDCVGELLDEEGVKEELREKIACDKPCCGSSS